MDEPSCGAAAAGAAHPRVEVAYSSLRKDRLIKAPLPPEAFADVAAAIAAILR